MYFEEVTHTYQQAEAKATSEGKKCIPADDYHLQIDIDSEDDWKHWKTFSEFFLTSPFNNNSNPHKPALRAREITIGISSSGLPHRHITIELWEPMDVWKRIALQALLGSHLVREALNAYRVMIGNTDCPIVFFEKEEEQPTEGRRIILE